MKELKATDLRIGNLVEYNLSCGNFDDDAQALPLAIINIFRHRVKLDDGFANLYTLSELKPIPITPEILEKAGFTKVQLMDCVGFKLNGFSILMWDKSGFDAEDVRGPNQPELKYLHQLQNLYLALTGTELQIKP